MSRGLSSSQKDKLKNFIALTTSDEKLAVHFLHSSDWNLDLALNNYYDDSRSSSGRHHQSSHNGPSEEAKRQRSSLKSGDEKKINAVFDKYHQFDPKAEREADKLHVAAIQRLLSDLDLSEVSREVLVLVWKCQCEQQLIITRQELLRGFADLGVDSVDGLKKRLKAFCENELATPVVFRQLYIWTFKYGSPREAKNLDLESALAYWNILLGPPANAYPNFQMWVEFLQKAQRKAIPRDTWNLFLDFIETVSPDFSNYDADGAWPVIIDEFVEYARLLSKSGSNGEDNRMQVS